ncbi:Filamin-C [Orchesella cincta]|uniref:Filamin-C n=1 Tax=Orchesella cincta TaxID=48709 RepID=A0A1D2MTU9_ORCCI|nr:Filamin-C [Orchesella cincta]
MASDITISGDAAQKGFLNHPNTFKIHLCGLNVSKLLVEPHEGDYSFAIMFDEEHVEGSPFQVKVEGEFELHTEKVKVTGAALKEGRNKQINEIQIDARDSGIEAPLQYQMEGTSKPDVSIRNNANGTCTLTYKPWSTGLYKLHLKYLDKPVPGSPFQIRKIHNWTPISSDERNLTKAVVVGPVTAYVQQLLKNQTQGFFIEAGANDGEFLQPTRCF